MGGCRWGALLSLICWMPAFAQSAGSVAGVGIHRVAGNVYMLDTDTRKFEGGNVALLTGKDGALLVDTNVASRSEPIIAAIKGLSVEPVRYVINTHCHGDHTGGNAAFARLGATIIAHVNVRKRLEQNKCDRIELGAPTITFKSALTLYFDDEEVRVIKVPTRHTDGDSIVYFAKANVVHTGDVFVSLHLPFRSKYAGGDILGLTDALRAIVEQVPADAQVIPGHGPLASVSDIQRAIRILDAMKETIAVQVAKGRTLDELKAMKLLEPWKGDLGPGDQDFYLRDFYDALTGKAPEPKYRLEAP
jgi:cyclase